MRNFSNILLKSALAMILIGIFAPEIEIKYSVHIPQIPRKKANIDV